MPKSAKYQEITCESVLGKLGVLNTRFWTKYCFDPYTNCEFNCAYCNTSTFRHVGSKTVTVPVQVKVNAPQVLTREMSQLKRKGVISMGLAMDPYQPAEEKYQITRQLLEVCERNSCPFAIGTKSDLILRDMDLISRASNNSRCCVSLSITTLDENLAKFLEPNAPSPKKRLATLRKLSKAGILTGVWVSPIIPYLTDNEENMSEVIKSSVENGAAFVLGTVLDTRNSAGYKYFLKENPKLVSTYEELYRGQDGARTYYPNDFYLYGLYKRFISICRNFGVKRYMTHFPSPKQEMRFYIRNCCQLRTTNFSELLYLLNLPPTGEILQTVQIRSGNWAVSKSLLRVLHYFPH